MDGMGKYDDDSDSESGRMGASPQLSKKTLCQKDLLQHRIRLENHSLFFFSGHGLDMFVVGLRLFLPKSFRICLFTRSRDRPSSPNWELVCDLSWLLTFRSREIG